MIILTAGPEGPVVWEGRGLVPIFWATGGAKGNGTILDHILNLMLEVPTIVSVVPGGVYMVGTSGISIIVFQKRVCHWFRLNHGNDVGIIELLVQLIMAQVKG